MVSALLILSSLPLFERTPRIVRAVYLTFPGESIAPVSEKMLESMGTQLTFNWADHIRFYTLMSYKSPTEYNEPFNIRVMLIDDKGVKTFIGKNGNVTTGDKSWKLEPSAFLKLYLLFEGMANRNQPRLLFRAVTLATDGQGLSRWNE